jgi:hypothetical protein
MSARSAFAIAAFRFAWLPSAAGGLLITTTVFYMDEDPIEQRTVTDRFPIAIMG